MASEEDNTNRPKRKALDESPAAPAQEMPEEEKLCRFCFDGEEEGGPLISPCDCKGGQKWIHLSCLRRWQRMVLVSQPTHPDFWEDDIRHTKCNVCNAEFTCPPPTRQELMLGFTGPEIAALIGEGCIIGSHGSFNQMIENQIRGNPLLAHLSSVQHWLRGVYLITNVKEDRGEVEWTLEDPGDINQLFRRLDCTNADGGNPPYLELADGTKYDLQVNEGVFAGHDTTFGEMNERDLKMLLCSSLPCQLVFRPRDPTTSRRDCTDDKVRAVNLTRPFTPSGKLERRAQKIIQETKSQSVSVTYFKGGPCEDDRIVTCLVLGGRRRGYTVVQSFKMALLMAKRNAQNAREGRNNIAVGQQVTIRGLCKRKDLNGKTGFVQEYDASQQRFEVRLLVETNQQHQREETRDEPAEAAVDNVTNANLNQQQVVVKVRPINLEAQASTGICGANGTVFAFVGDARWTRVQLLGEIAKTSWGLCHAQIEDLLHEASTLYGSVHPRLIYAPQSEMSRQGSSEESDRNDMIVLRRVVLDTQEEHEVEGQ